MNIIIINHYAGSPDYGMEFRPFYLAKKWLELGHTVTILAADYSHLRNNNPKITKSYTKEIIEGITYVWFTTPEYKGNGVRRVFNMFTFVGKLFFYSGQLVKDFSPDVVISSSTYPLDIHASQFIAKKSNAKLIFEVHDIWPLTPMEIGGMSKNHPFVTIMQQAEDKAYKVSDSVVSMLPCAKEHMLSRGMIESKYNHIPNGVCLEEWEVNTDLLPTEHKEVINNLKQKGFFILGYAGGHALSNSLTTVLDAAELLKDHKIAVVLVGDGIEKPNLMKMKVDKNLDNVIFLNKIVKNAVPALLAMFDSALITWNKTTLYRFGVSPNKIFDYMIAKKPIIQAIEAGNDMVKESGCGISVPPEEPEQLAQAMLNMSKKTSDERDVMGMLAKNYVLKNHDYNKLAQQFIEVMEAH